MAKSPWLSGANVLVDLGSLFFFCSGPFPTEENAGRVDLLILVHVFNMSVVCL